MAETTTCRFCYEFPAVSEGYCAACFQQISLDRSKKKAVPTPTVPRTNTPTATWQIVMGGGSLTPSGSSLFKERDGMLAAVLACIMNHQNDDSATNFGDQNTIWDHPSSSTTSVDYQGTRAGGNYYWIDIQGQAGGGGGKRKSFWQIMVQAGAGVPSQADVTDAINRSLAQTKRAVMRMSNVSSSPP